MHPQRPPTRFQLGEAQEEFAEEHRKLMATLNAIETAATEGDARTLVQRLQAGLVAHFDVEERPDGLFDWLGALIGGGRDRIEALWNDHHQLLAEVKALAALARATDEPSPGPLKDAIAAFAAHLREHERNENLLVSEAIDATRRDD